MTSPSPQMLMEQPRLGFTVWISPDVAFQLKCALGCYTSLFSRLLPGDPRGACALGGFVIPGMDHQACASSQAPTHQVVHVHVRLPFDEGRACFASHVPIARTFQRSLYCTLCGLMFTGCCTNLNSWVCTGSLMVWQGDCSVWALHRCAGAALNGIHNRGRSAACGWLGPWNPDNENAERVRVAIVCAYQGTAGRRHTLDRCCAGFTCPPFRCWSFAGGPQWPAGGIVHVESGGAFHRVGRV